MHHYDVSSTRQRGGVRSDDEVIKRVQAAVIEAHVGKQSVRLADAAGDAYAFAAAQSRLAPGLRDHVGVAARLLEAGRPEEALSALDGAPAGASQSGPAFAEMRIRLLDALGRRDEAQAARWDLFSSTLSVDALRGHLKRLPDFDDVEREDQALGSGPIKGLAAERKG